MKFSKSIAMLFLTAAALSASSICDSTVFDGESKLSAADVTRATTAAQPLIDLGADVHTVITNMGGSPTLDARALVLQELCPSWKSPGGGRKSTLLLIIVAPNERKAGIYYGAALKGELDNSWNRIASDYMKPYFKSADWAGGLIATEQQLAKRITAVRDETVHGATTTTVNQATDLSGFWSILAWVLGFLAGVGILIAAFSLSARRRKGRVDTSEAQQAAVLARNTTAAKLNKIQRLQREAEDRGAKFAHQSKAVIDEAYDQFGRLSQSSATDADDKGKSVNQYRDIAAAYAKIDAQIGTALRWMADLPPAPLNGDEDAKRDEPTDAPKPKIYGATTIVAGEYKVPNYTPAEHKTPSFPNYSATQQPVTHSTTVINSGSGNDFASGLVLGELLSDRRETPIFESRPSYTPPAPDPTPSWPSSNSDSGGSSSWASDLSNSSSDLGGSSDFGGSDSGGGGDTDF